MMSGTKRRTKMIVKFLWRRQHLAKQLPAFLFTYLAKAGLKFCALVSSIFIIPIYHLKNALILNILQYLLHKFIIHNFWWDLRRVIPLSRLASEVSPQAWKKSCGRPWSCASKTWRSRNQSETWVLPSTVNSTSMITFLHKWRKQTRYLAW